MIAIHCGLELPESLTKSLNQRVILLPGVIFQCELDIVKNQGEFFNEKEAMIEPGYWDRLWKDGRLVLEVTLKFDVEFSAAEEEQKRLLSYHNDRAKNSPKQFAESELKKEPVIRSEDEPQKPELVKLIEHIFSLNNPNSVQLCSEGIGGTYFIHDSQNHKIAVFKPTDEEPGAQFNPKGLVTEPLLPPGGGAQREVAAYLLDHQHFAGVPETYFLSHPIKHSSFKTPKMGSIQKYVENIENHDMSSSRFTVEDVHKIGIFDVRLMNMDRNEENFLIQLKKDSTKLIPIDHSYILPPDLSFVWFEWLHWKQAKQPFQKSHLDYIESLDIHKDSAILHNLGFSKEAIKTMMISTTFLKIAALKFGYNLFQIGSIVSRKKLTEESELEKMVQKAESLVEEKEKFLEVLSKIIIEELQNKAQK